MKDNVQTAGDIKNMMKNIQKDSYVNVQKTTNNLIRASQLEELLRCLRILFGPNHNQKPVMVKSNKDNPITEV